MSRYNRCRDIIGQAEDYEADVCSHSGWDKIAELRAIVEELRKTESLRCASVTAPRRMEKPFFLVHVRLLLPRCAEFRPRCDRARSRAQSEMLGAFPGGEADAVESLLTSALLARRGGRSRRDNSGRGQCCAQVATQADHPNTSSHLEGCLKYSVKYFPLIFLNYQ